MRIGDVVMRPEAERISEAYIRMREEARYRPAAPGDGLGCVDLTDAELADPAILQQEAKRYARMFIAEEDTCKYFIGITNYSTNRATVYSIEAARLMCGGFDGHRFALKLLRMAARDLADALRIPKSSVNCSSR